MRGRKLAAALFAGVLALAMPAMAFAADDVYDSTLEVNSPEPIIIAKDDAIGVVIGGPSGSLNDVIVDSVSDTTTSAANVPAGADVVQSIEVNGQLQNGATATITFSKLQPNQLYYVYAQHSNGIFDKYIFTSNANGVGTITVSCFSIFSVVEADSVEDVAQGSGTTEGGYVSWVTVRNTENVDIEQTEDSAYNTPEGSNVVVSFLISGDIPSGEKADVTFRLPKANTVYTVYVDHILGDNDAERFDEYVRRTNSDNELTISTDKFSIWTIVEGGVLPAESGSDGSGSSTGSDANGLTSPQTGYDLTAPIVVSVVAIALGATTAFALRKKVIA